MLKSSADGSVLWNKVLQPRGPAVSQLEFTLDGRILVSARGNDKSAQIWHVSDPESEPIVLRQVDDVDKLMFYSIAITPDGRHVVSGDQPSFGDLSADRLLKLARQKAGRSLSAEEVNIYPIDAVR